MHALLLAATFSVKRGYELPKNYRSDFGFFFSIHFYGSKRGTD